MEAGGGGKPLPSEWRGASICTIYKGKGEVSSCDSYRGIFLLNTLGKLLSSVISRRIHVLAEEYIEDTQSGFRMNRSAAQAILSVRLLAQAAQDRDVPVVVIFIDLKKAFDSIPRKLILDILCAIGCPPSLVALVAQLHDEVLVKVIGMSDADRFEMSRGVRQGSCEGPVLFNLCWSFLLRRALEEVPSVGVDLISRKMKDGVWLADSERPFRLTSLCYADDLAIVAHSTDALSLFVNALQRITGPLGVNISKQKTEFLWLSGKPGDPAPVMLNGEALKEVTEFNYLGSLIEGRTQQSRTREVTANVKRASKALAGLRPLFRVRKCPIDLKVRLAKAVVYPAALYACETWRLTATKEREFDAFLNRLRCAVMNRGRIDRRTGVKVRTERL